MTRMVLVFFFVIFSLAVQADADPLPSWTDSAIKQNIIQFVHQVTDQNSSDYVPPQDRIATFDNDGTLWLEQPIYTQVIFALDRIKKLAPLHPEWKKQEPFQSILNHQYDHLTLQDVEKILAMTHSGMTVEEFTTIEKQWLETAKNPRFKRVYTKLVYQPMIEMIQYLQKNHFKVYIVSGGGQEFMRTFSQKIYGIPPEQVIGTAGKTKFEKFQLVKLPQVLFVDDHAGKPEAINLFIGKKPIIAFGNSDGDREMLEWTQSGKGKRMMVLVHHDDAKREYAYDTKSKVGTFSESLMKKAQTNNWQIISMKNNWKTIFANP